MTTAAGRFEALIRAASGHAMYHEVSPEEFGPPRNRLGLFRDCLQVLLRRYPDIRIVLSGSQSVLLDMGLVPGADILVGNQFVTAVIGPTDTENALRLTFSPR